MVYTYLSQIKMLDILLVIFTVVALILIWKYKGTGCASYSTDLWWGQKMQL